MELFSWKNDYSVKVGSIDSDHQKLFDIINSLFTAMSKGEGRQVISGLVKELQSYTIYHFNREETFFRVTSYPNAANHLEQHKIFVSKVKEYKVDLSCKCNFFVKQYLI